MAKKTTNKKKQLTSEEYKAQRDALVEKYEKGQILEHVYNKQLQALYAQRIPLYRQGGEGFIIWAEENVRVEAYLPGTSIKRPTYLSDLSREPEPETGKSWWDFWCWQKEECRKALAIGPDNRLIHNLIIFCTERGEGKSFMAVLVQAWKFFVFSDQRIFLAANSKEQSSFAHREVLEKFLRISPTLLALVGGEKKIKQKEIAIYDSKGLKISFITTVSTFTGVLSNATGFTFSEFFQSRPDAPFFNDIYTSTRNTPNALGVIDSTVSTRDHKLYELYEQKQKNAKGSENWYFLYKCNPTADISGYYSPANTQKQLDGFKAANAANPAAFDMYFKNTWDTAQKGLFSKTNIAAMSYIGADGLVGNQDGIKDALEKLEKYEEQVNFAEQKNLSQKPNADVEYFERRRLIPIHNYTPALTDANYSIPTEVLEELTEIYDTDWAIGVGLDRSDPMAIRSSAQTVLTCVAKGLPGSKSNPTQYMVGLNETKSPNYIYILIGYYVARKNTSGELQQVIGEWNDLYYGIESFSSDRYGVSDVAGWLIEEEIVKKPEVVHFSEQKQTEVFSILYTIVDDCKFKKPDIGISGIRHSDMLEEQFDHFSVTFDGRKTTYGSDEKKKLGGVQDDGVDSIAMNIYGLRHVGLDMFRVISAVSFFGTYVDNK